MNIFAMNYRQCDGQGCGHFLASRGAGLHMGVDMACPPGTEVGSPVRGQVTKIGWPYEGVDNIRYVQILAERYRYRVFYVSPEVAVGDYVEIGDIIGRSQRLDSMGRGGTQHVHFEILNMDNEYIDPTPVIVALRGTLRDAPVV